MKIFLKTPSEIKIMKDNGKKMSVVFSLLTKFAKVGVNLLDIEKKAVQLIKQAGGEPGFALVPNYHWATCLNINEGIVHGIPRNYKLREGDILTIDSGMFYQGFNSDMSATFLISAKTKKEQQRKYQSINKFLTVGKTALQEAIKQALPGNRVGNISQKIQEIIEQAGYHPSYNLTGHGIGRELHEDPMIPGILRDPIEKTPLLKPGMAIAIEVIYTQGKPELIINPKNKWTIKTRDGKISAVFEKTIAINKNGPLVLTELPFFLLK